MMLKERLLEDLKNSMKEKNINRKNVVQMVRAAILQIEKDQNIEVSDEKILEIIAKEAKRREDALAEYKKAQREDLVKQAEEEIKVLEEYLPKKMSKEELEEKIKEIIQKLGATTMKDMGKVMKQAKEEIGVAADGKTINEVVKSMLG
ncbi:MAG TPA: GatB/YqeY domain-containing protein [Clostridiaceae bacterium]|nr:GatB/YqeY domain-containing protein [Clostridiaceae bacterium]